MAETLRELVVALSLQQIVFCLPSCIILPGHLQATDCRLQVPGKGQKSISTCGDKCAGTH